MQHRNNQMGKVVNLVLTVLTPNQPLASHTQTEATWNNMFPYKLFERKPEKYFKTKTVFAALPLCSYNNKALTAEKHVLP